MGHVRDRWSAVGPTGRKVRSPRYGSGLRWQARWVEAGRTRSKSFATKDAAEAHLARVAVGEVAPRQRLALTFGEYATAWRVQQLHHRASTSEATRGVFERHILPELGSLPLDRVSRQDIQSAVVCWSSLLAPSTVHVTYGFVASVFKHAIEDRLVQFSPCSRISLPAKSKARVEPLTVEQVAEITARVPAWYRSMVTVGAATGLRGGELRGLSWDRISEGVVWVDRQLVGIVDKMPVFGPPKSDAGFRSVSLGRVAQEALEVHRERFPPGGTGLVWVNRAGSPVSRSDAGEVWRQASAGLGLKPRSGWHELRHFNASCLIAAGLSPRAVADRLGHADASETLSTYSHLWPSDQDRAITAIDSALGPYGTVTASADLVA